MISYRKALKLFFLEDGDNIYDYRYPEQCLDCFSVRMLAALYEKDPLPIAEDLIRMRDAEERRSTVIARGYIGGRVKRK